MRPTPAPLRLSLSKPARWALVVLAALSAANASAQSRLPVDQIVVRKADRAMDLYSGGRLLHTIEGIQLGGAPVGHKRFQGDRRTPEGRYAIDYGNPDSSYNLSLHISYPNAQDAAYAYAQGRDPGGLIFIHGSPNDYPHGRPPGDWTDGCIAVSDEEIEALWQAVPDGAVIDILP